MKKPKAPRLVSVAVITTITVIFWVFFTLYRVLTTKPAPSVDPKLLEPIDATLETDKLEELNSKIFFESGNFTPIVDPSSDLESLEITPSPIPSMQVTPSEALDDDEDE